MKLLAFLETIKPLNEGIMDAMIETAVPAAINRLRDEILSGSGDGGARELFYLYEYGDPHEEPDDTYENIERKWAEWLVEWSEARVENAAYEIASSMSYNRHSHMDGIVIYRVIKADENFPSNITARGLGEYWSWEEGAAEAHWAGDGEIEYLIVGLVDPKHVDWEHTLFQNAHPNFDHEREIYIPEGSPIELYKLLLGNGDEVDPAKYGGRQMLQASIGESGVACSARFARLSELREAAGGQFVYHATMAKNLGTIMQKGLTFFNPSLWVKAGTGERYQEDPSVFAFEHPVDAWRWAAKMEWEFKEPAVVIILKRGDSWGRDPSDDISLQMGKGKALQSMETIPASDIVGAKTVAQIGTPVSTGLHGAEYEQHVEDVLT